MVYLKNRGLEPEMEGDNLEPRAPMRRSGGGIFAKVIITILVVVIIAGLGYLVFTKYVGSDDIAQVSDNWQAVFLTNGQVYFGKVQRVTDETLVLNNIYYLQVVTKPLQQTQTGTANQQQAQQELTLIKLGNEIHGPADNMIINRDQILLTENLKKDSRVVEAINNYLKDQSTKK